MERLQKLIAESGYTSRRKAEMLITEGKVTVNGKIVNTLGAKAGPNDLIEVEGHPLEKEEMVTYVFYKPEGCVSTVSDEHDRRTVVDYINDSRRIYPVGRLDYDTSGILLVSNDGEFANQMMQPKSHLAKVYEVTFTGILRRQTSNIFEKGMILEGKKLKPVKVTNVKGSKTNEKTSCTLTLTEGKNHQIKKMLEAFGHQVTKLKRIQYGPLTLEGLNKGQYRLLSPHEKKQLYILTKKPSA